jgi:hypothetical protein
MNVSFHALFRVDYRFHIGRVQLVGNKRTKNILPCGRREQFVSQKKREKINKYKKFIIPPRKKFLFFLGRFRISSPHTPILSRPVACLCMMTNESGIFNRSK